MKNAGGILGIIAGIFGVIAAIVTLFFGGLGSTVGSQGAGTVVGLGWGGVVFSFLAIVFGAVVFAKPKGAGIALVVTSILGAVLGGTLVAICMALSLVGGILGILGAKGNTPNTVASSETVQLGSKKKPGIWIGIVAGVLGLVVIAGMVGKGSGDKGEKADPLAELASAAPSNLQPTGELSEIFSLGSKNTDLQRENKLKEITGQIVEWRLPVYEVAKKGNVYRIQTGASVSIGQGRPGAVGTFVDITPRTEADRAVIEALKTGDVISFKGRIAGSSFRSLEIKPAVLYANSAAMQSSPAPSGEVRVGIPTTAIPYEGLPKKLETVAGVIEHRDTSPGQTVITLNGAPVFQGLDATWQRPIRLFSISGGREAVLVASSGGRGTSCETLYFFLVLAKGVAPVWTPAFGSCSTDGTYTQQGDVITIFTPKPGGFTSTIFDGTTTKTDGKPLQMNEDVDPSK